MALCGKGCRGCVHYRRIGADMACHYCVDTGKLRGCEIKKLQKVHQRPEAFGGDQEERGGVKMAEILMTAFACLFMLAIGFGLFFMD